MEDDAIVSLIEPQGEVGRSGVDKATLASWALSLNNATQEAMAAQTHTAAVRDPL